MKSRVQDTQKEEIDRLQVIIRSLEHKLGKAQAEAKSLEQSLYKRAVRDLKRSDDNRTGASQHTELEAEVTELKEELATVHTALNSSQRSSKVTQDALQAETDKCLRMEEQQRSALETIISLVNTAESSRQALEEVIAKGKNFLDAIPRTRVVGPAAPKSPSLKTPSNSQWSGWSFAQPFPAPLVPQPSSPSKPVQPLKSAAGSKRKPAPESGTSGNVPSGKRRALPSLPTAQNVAPFSKTLAATHSAEQPPKPHTLQAPTFAADPETMPSPILKPSTSTTNLEGFPQLSAIQKPDLTATAPKKLLLPNNGRIYLDRELTLPELLREVKTRAAAGTLPPMTDRVRAIQLAWASKKKKPVEEVDDPDMWTLDEQEEGIGENAQNAA